MCVYVYFVMYGCFDNCVGVLVICVLVFIVFCIVCSVFLYCFVYVYLFLGTADVGTVVKALRYKSEGSWFDSRWCHCNFSLT
jgi:hypothetical protein